MYWWIKKPTNQHRSTKSAGTMNYSRVYTLAIDKIEDENEDAFDFRASNDDAWTL